MKERTLVSAQVIFKDLKLVHGGRDSFRISTNARSITVTLQTNFLPPTHWSKSLRVKSRARVWLSEFIFNLIACIGRRTAEYRRASRARAHGKRF